MKRFGKIWNGFVTVLIILIVVAAVGILAVVLTTPSDRAPMILNHSLLCVDTDSMEPTIGEGDAVLVRGVNASELKVGDIISFYSSDPRLNGALNTHRIAEIGERADGTAVFYTQGDKEGATRDIYTVTADRILGKVVGNSAAFGWFIRFATNRQVFFLVIFIPLMYIVVRNVVSLVRQVKNTRLPEENEEEDDGNSEK